MTPIGTPELVLLLVALAGMTCRRDVGGDRAKKAAKINVERAPYLRTSGMQNCAKT